MRVNHFNWKIGGEAGYGIKVIGMMFAKICSRGGLQIFDYTEYPSLIRGGHNAYEVTVSDKPVHVQGEPTDLLVALNQETIDRHADELTQGAAVMYDPAVIKNDPSQKVRKDAELVHVPFIELAVQVGGQKLMQNTVALGASFALVGYPFEYIESVIKSEFERKGKDVYETNIKTARAGYDYVQQHWKKPFGWRLTPVKGAPKRMVLSGTEAMGMGALAAGMQFYAGYPMTPSSPLLHYVAKEAPKYNAIVKHAEDEISVINMAIGASFMGVRSMIATSGGGFSLMVEAVGLAGITETPLVIVEAMRPGPATGLPTWTEQGDLRFVIHAAQGEFPRVVFAPGDVTECFYLMADAFNLADKYQIPVFVLTDKYLQESNTTLEPFDPSKITIDRGAIVREGELSEAKQYLRYAPTPTGVSPRTLPGMKHGVFVANSDEHDPYGLANEEIANRNEQQGKRMRKLEKIAKELPQPKLLGDAKADVTFVSWGSTKGPIMEAASLLRKEGMTINHLRPIFLHPFPAKAVEQLLKRVKNPILVENNGTGQLGGLIREHTGVLVEKRILKTDGRPFYAEELARKTKKLL